MKTNTIATFARIGRVIFLAAAATFALARPSQALVINASYVGMTNADISTIQSAISFFETTFTNPISVNIQFDAVSTGLGETYQFVHPEPYTGFVSSLQNDGNPVAQAAVQTLPTSQTDPVVGGSYVYFSGANARALGYTTGASTITYSGLCTSYQGDACIGLNTAITTTGNGTLTGSYSLQAVTQHEIDEVLGLGSALSSQNLKPNFVRPEDLYRYSAPGVRSFATNPWTSGSSSCPSGTPNAYLSLDGGKTNLANFNNCNNGADYGDWASSSNLIQVQDAYATPGTTPLLTTTSPEVLALQAIGYTVQTPEPMSIALLATGLVGIAAVRRRSKVR